MEPLDAATGFVPTCRAALAEGALAVLREHAAGTSPTVRTLHGELGSDDRARAIASLALALAAAVEPAERADLLRNAIALWREPGQPPPADLPTSLVNAGETSSALRRICSYERRLRLQGLHDVSLELADTPPRRLRSASTMLLATNGTGRLLAVEAHLLEGALPGLFEVPSAALADRGDEWRAMERTVEELVDPEGAQAIRYQLTDIGHAKLFLGHLDGESGGLAVAVAAKRAAAGGRLRLDRDTAITAAVDRGGRTHPVQGIAEKTAPLKGKVSRLLVASDQERELARDEPDRPRSDERRAIVNAGLDVLGAKDLEQALRKLRWRPPPLLWATAVLLAAVLVAAAAVVLIRSQPDAGLEQRVAETQMGSKIDAANRGFGETDPDRMALLRAEAAIVQPNAASLSALLDANQALAKRIATFQPAGNVTEVEVDQAEQLVATGGENGELRVWNSNAHREETLPRIDAIEDEIRMIAISPDAHWIAAAGDDSFVLAGRSSYGLSEEMEEEIPTSAVAFSTDGGTVYVGTEDMLGSSHLEGGRWSPLDWEYVDYRDHYVRDVFPLDDDRVAYCVEAKGNTQELWRLDFHSGLETPIRDDHGRTVPCPAAELRPGLMATMQGSDDRVLTIGEVDGSRWRETARHLFPEEMLMLGTAAGGGRVFAAGQTWISVVSAAGQVVAQAPLRPSDTAVAVGRGGHYFAASSADDSIRLESLQADDPQTPRLQLDDSTAFGWPVDWSENGERLAVGTQEGDVSVFEPGSPEGGSQVWRHVFPGMVRAVDMDPAGRWVFAAGTTGQVARVDARHPDAEIDYSVPFDAMIRDLELSPDGKHLAVAGAPGTGVLMINPDLLGFEQAEEVDGLSLAWLDPDRLLVASGIADGSDISEPALRVFDTELETLGETAPSPGGGYIALGVDGDRVAAVGSDGILEVFDVGGAAPRLLRSTTTGNGLATDVSWSEDGRILAVVGDGGNVSFFDAASLQEIGSRPIGESQGGASMAVHGEELATLALGRSFAKLIPFGVKAWAQQICDRTRRFLSPAEWVELVGPWPSYRQPCRPPR